MTASGDGPSKEKQSDEPSEKGPPKTWHHLDEESVGKVKDWIESQHPEACTVALADLVVGAEFAYRAATEILGAHCIGEHGVGLEGLIGICEATLPVNIKASGLLDALSRRQNELLEDLLQEWRGLPPTRGSRLAIELLARALDVPAFERLWTELWERGLATARPDLVGSAIWAAAFTESHAPKLERLLKDRLAEVYRVSPDETIVVLSRSPHLSQIRDETLVLLLGIDGVGAAKRIISESWNAQDPPPSIIDATRLLLVESPTDEATVLGLASCLSLDPDFAIPIVARIVNGLGEEPQPTSELEWKIRELEGPLAKRLLDAAAEDALQREDPWHKLLAGRHHFVMRNARVTVRWHREHLNDARAVRYMGKLIIDYLSDPRDTKEEQVRELIEIAGQLHRKYGTSSEEELRKRWGITDRKSPDYELLLAIAYGRDLTDPPRELNLRNALETVKKYPVTYDALGGGALDRHVSNGRAFPHAALYEIDVAGEMLELDLLKTKGKITPEQAGRQRAWLGRIEAQRESWERTFASIKRSGGQFPSTRLRADENVWNEMPVWACLLQRFEVDYEPSGLPGFGLRRPEFLLRSPDGELIFEMQTMDTRLDWLKSSVRTSTGGEPKKRLLNKVHQKFIDSEADFGKPVVIGLQVDPFELGFAMENSLYGPHQISMKVEQPTGKVVSEGSTRDAEKAFFEDERAACVSAVAGLSAYDPEREIFAGELFRSSGPPRHQLSHELYLRLRGALFGERPPHLVRRMMAIPTITPEEAELLVNLGVDEPSFFAMGWLPYPDGIPMTRDRFEELRSEAIRKSYLDGTNEVRYLKSAEGLDLQPLYDVGIFTVDQLLRLASRVEGMDEKAWQALLEEAREYRGFFEDSSGR